MADQFDSPNSVSTGVGAPPSTPAPQAQGPSDDFIDNPAYSAQPQPSQPADFIDNPDYSNQQAPPAQDQSGLVSRTYETSGLKGAVDLAKQVALRPIDLYKQAVTSMKAGNWADAADAASKIVNISQDKDNPLVKAAEQIIMHPIQEAAASFKENRKAGQGVAESLLPSPVATAENAVNEVKSDTTNNNIPGAVGDILTAPLRSHLAGEVPVLGSAIQQEGEDVNKDLHDKNYAALAGDIIGPLMTLGIGKTIGSIGEGAEGAEGVSAGEGAGSSTEAAAKVKQAANGTGGAKGLPTGPRPGSVNVAGENIPVASTHPQLGNQSILSKLAESAASPEAAKKFVNEQVQPAAVRATQSNFTNTALNDVDKLRDARGEEPASETAPALHTVSDISDFMKSEAKKTYQKLDEAAKPEIEAWDAKYGEDAPEQPAANSVQLFGPDGKPLPKAVEAEIPPRPKSFTELQDQINNAENTIKPKSGASQVDRENAIKNLPQYNQEMKAFVAKHSNVVSPGELDAADGVYRNATRYDWIANKVRTATKGAGQGGVLPGDTISFNANSLENLPRQFDTKFGEGSFSDLLGQEGIHNYNDIVNTLKNPQTSGFFQDWIKKAPFHTGEFAMMPVNRIADNILFNPEAGQTLLKLFRKTLDTTKVAAKVGAGSVIAGANQPNDLHSKLGPEFGKRVSVNGQTGTVIGNHPKSGKPVVNWDK